jgi:hypothetical protein
MDRQTIWIIVGISLALLFVLLFVIARRQGYTLSLPGMPAMPNMVGWARIWPILLKLSLPPLVVYGLIWLVQATYPEQFQNYLERGGPSYSLIAFALLLVVASFIPSEALKKVAVAIMVFIFGLPFVWALLGTMFFGNPSPAGSGYAAAPPPGWVARETPAPAATAPENLCDGIYRTRTLTSVPTLVTGARGCRIDWNIVEGGVIVYNEQNEPFERVVTKDSPMGHSNFRIVRWKAATPQAIVDVALVR